jgi:hypothetical protein
LHASLAAAPATPGFAAIAPAPTLSTSLQTSSTVLAPPNLDRRQLHQWIAGAFVASTPDMSESGESLEDTMSAELASVLASSSTDADLMGSDFESVLGDVLRG